MLLKDLIKQLQELYEKESTPELLEIFGEPEIMIDTFKYDKERQCFNYYGFDKYIDIDKTADGVYNILSRVHATRSLNVFSTD